MAGFGLGLLPLLAVTIGFKLALAPHNDLAVSAQWAHLVDPSRLALIAKYLGGLFVAPGPFHLPLIPLLGGYLILQGVAALPPHALRLEPSPFAWGWSSPRMSPSTW